jgi:hypothetical protein
MLICIDGKMVPLDRENGSQRPSAQILQFVPRSNPKIIPMTEERRQMFNHLADRVFSETFGETVPYGGAGIDGMPFDGKEPA